MLTILAFAVGFALGFAGGREYPTALAAAKADAIRVETAIKAALHISVSQSGSAAVAGGGAPVPPVVSAAATAPTTK